MIPRLHRTDEYCYNCAEAQEKNTCTQIRWVDWFGRRWFVKYVWQV